MACTSPNQSQPSPTRFRMSGDRRDSEDASLGDDEHDGELMDHVRQLIVDLLVDEHDGRHSLSAGLQTGEGREGQDGRTVPKHRSNNPEAEEVAAATLRERLLEEKLARALIELAGEQDNLRLAANAGNALLEQLRVARGEMDMLHDELEAAQIAGERSERELHRLRDQNKALENELQRYDAPYGSWESSWQDDSSSHQLRRRGSLRSSRSRSFNRSLNDGSNSCELCAARETEVVQLEQRADEFRRRCLELELTSERDQQRARELSEEIAQWKKHNKDQQLQIARVQHDLDFVTTQLDQRTEEVTSAQAARDALRRTARRLEAENEDLRSRLAAREELVTKLENSKARATTQIQVAENRTASAQAETKRVTETLQQLQKQLDHALLRQQQQQSAQSNGAVQRDDETEVAPQEKEARDMEHLLEDASREVAALRLENRILRRQSSDASSDGGQLRGRRRKTLCADSAATTAADVLALGSRKSKKETDTKKVSSNSGSDAKPAIATPSQLPPLEIDTMEGNDTGTALSAESDDPVSGGGKIRRKMSLELNWVDKTSTTVTSTLVKDNRDLTRPPSAYVKPRGLSVPSMSEVSCEEVDEKAGDADQARLECLMLSPTVVKRPGALSRHINDHCVIGGATKVNTSDVRLYSLEGRIRRSTIGSSNGSDHKRVRELPIEEFKKAAVESPPKSPLILGLSFIACATAATAAGLLVRR